MALPYTRSEAKEWARREFQGVCNVLLPTFTTDLRQLNERAIRHDVQKSVEHGFWGTLLVSECSTTLEEMRQVVDIAVDERPAGFHLVMHGSFDTLKDTAEMSRYAAEQGVEALLLSYPPTLYPKSWKDIAEFTKEVAKRTDQAIILFAVPMWDFRRLDPRGFPLEALVEMAEIDTVVTVKYEAGRPGNGGMLEALERLGDKVLISDPMEFNSPMWTKHFGMQWMGTSNYNYMGDRIPKMFNLMRSGQWDEAMKIYWSLQPAREANESLRASVSGAHFIHRPAWKYMGWLSGDNGGPLRMPQMRLHTQQMNAFRKGLEASGIEVTSDPDEAFYFGRNPTE